MFNALLVQCEISHIGLEIPYTRIPASSKIIAKYEKLSLKILKGAYVILLFYMYLLSNKHLIIFYFL
jgi:hypothetical protein